MHAYDPGNVFALILQGKIPSLPVHEDERTYAFLDIMPRAPGHTLVVPRAPARNLLDVAPEDLHAVMTTAQRIARAAMVAFEAHGITLAQYSEAAGGQEVFHLHVHVVPRHDGVAMHPPAARREEMDLLKAHQAKLRAALGALA